MMAGQRSITVGAIEPASQVGRSRTKRSSDLSGAEINDQFSQDSDEDSPRRRSGAGIHGGVNQSVVTLGVDGKKRAGGATIPGTGQQYNTKAHLHQSAQNSNVRNRKYNLLTVIDPLATGAASDKKKNAVREVSLAEA